MWLDSAVNDVVRLKEFIAKENKDAAKRAAAAIGTAALRLVENQLIGKPINNLPDYRDLLTRFGASGYVLRYRVLSEIIYIVHVRHYRENDFQD